MTGRSVQVVFKIVQARAVSVHQRHGADAVRLAGAQRADKGVVCLDQAADLPDQLDQEIGPGLAGELLAEEQHGFLVLFARRNVPQADVHAQGLARLVHKRRAGRFEPRPAALHGEHLVHRARTFSPDHGAPVVFVTGFCLLGWKQVLIPTADHLVLTLAQQQEKGPVGPSIDALCVLDDLGDGRPLERKGQAVLQLKRRTRRRILVAVHVDLRQPLVDFSAPLAAPSGERSASKPCFQA